uniref:ORF051 n=1 Tax=Spodoptera frugiperda granulovirus TaxID=307454 RepID=A0A346QVX0_9BBAC|nr:ORF051 [Spodoptera frugiperda granulovirus]
MPSIYDNPIPSTSYADPSVYNVMVVEQEQEPPIYLIDKSLSQKVLRFLHQRYTSVQTTLPFLAEDEAYISNPMLQKLDVDEERLNMLLDRKFRNYFDSQPSNYNVELDNTLRMYMHDFAEINNYRHLPKLVAGEYVSYMMENGASKYSASTDKLLLFYFIDAQDMRQIELLLDGNFAGYDDEGFGPEIVKQFLGLDEDYDNDEFNNLFDHLVCVSRHINSMKELIVAENMATRVSVCAERARHVMDAVRRLQDVAPDRLPEVFSPFVLESMLLFFINLQFKSTLFFK